MPVNPTRRPRVPLRAVTRTSAGLLLLAALTACGEDAPAPQDATPASDAEEAAAPAPDEPAPTDDERSDPEAPDDDEAGPEAPAAGPSGTVTVAGTAYEMDRVTRCATDEDDLSGFGELDLDLFALGEDDTGDRTSIFVQVGELSGAPFESVSWDGPEGTWGEPQAIDVDLTDDRVTGSATLVDSLTFEGSLEVTFDLPVPADEERC